MNTRFTPLPASALRAPSPQGLVSPQQPSSALQAPSPAPAGEGQAPAGDEGDPAAGNGGKTQRRVIVCAGTGCVANGAYQVVAAFAEQIQAAGISVTTEFKPEVSAHDLRLNQSGCQGFCQMGPLVTILPDEILYNKVKVADVAEIVRQTLVGGQVVDRLLYVDPATKKHCRGIHDIPFYQRQQRFVLKECGTIDPEDIHEYLHHGGYAAAKKAILHLTPEQIVPGNHKVRPARPRGRRLPDRPQMGGGARAEEREEIRHLQRRRRRSRRVHEPQRHGRQSAQRAGRLDDRRPRHRRR